MVANWPGLSRLSPFSTSASTVSVRDSAETFGEMRATRPAKGFPPFVEYAKRLGYPAKDCTYCHVSLQGGSDKLNARGNWMVAEKVRRDAVAVDVKWLKDYKPARAGSKARARKKG